MAQILDRGAQTFLIKITMNEYKELENMNFFSRDNDKKTPRKYSQAFINELKETEKEYSEGKSSGPFDTVDDLFTYLNNL